MVDKQHSIKLYGQFEVKVEHYKDTICVGTCRLCGRELQDGSEVLILTSDLFPESAVHRNCCHQRLKEKVDEPGLTVLALDLEARWNKAREHAVWFMT